MAIEKFNEAKELFRKVKTHSGADQPTKLLAEGLYALAAALHTEVANLQIQVEELQHRPRPR